MYNIKLPSPLSAFSASVDGNHYAVGMSDGTFLLRTKKFTREYKEDGTEIIDEEERLVQAMAKDHLTKTSKDYKYFYRG